MARIEESVEIKCPVNEVFDYTNIASNWSKWHETIPEAEQTSQGKVDVGTTFRGKYRMMGLTVNWTAKVPEHAQNEKWAKLIDSRIGVINEQLIYEAIEGGTKFTIVYDVEVIRLIGFLSSIIIGSMHKQLKLDLVNLKDIIEAQP